MILPSLFYLARDNGIWCARYRLVIAKAVIFYKATAWDHPGKWNEHMDRERRWFHWLCTSSSSDHNQTRSNLSRSDWRGQRCWWIEHGDKERWWMWQWLLGQKEIVLVILPILGLSTCPRPVRPLRKQTKSVLRNAPRMGTRRRYQECDTCDSGCDQTTYIGEVHGAEPLQHERMGGSARLVERVVAWVERGKLHEARGKRHA
jgi:hypothetical protein